MRDRTKVTDPSGSATYTITEFIQAVRNQGYQLSEYSLEQMNLIRGYDRNHEATKHRTGRGIPISLNEAQLMLIICTLETKGQYLYLHHLARKSLVERLECWECVKEMWDDATTSTACATSEDDHYFANEAWELYMDLSGASDRRNPDAYSAAIIGNPTCQELVAGATQMTSLFAKSMCLRLLELQYPTIHAESPVLQVHQAIVYDAINNKTRLTMAPPSNRECDNHNAHMDDIRNTKLPCEADTGNDDTEVLQQQELQPA